MVNKTLRITNSLKLLMLMILNTIYVELYKEKTPGLIYILTYTSPGREPFNLWSTKQKSFITNNCTFRNCYIVKDRNYFQDVTDYNVILFNPSSGLGNDLPIARSDNQFYVFTSVEPAAYIRLGEEWNFFFNYTWTYRLDSDIVYPYFFVRNKRGEIVGPKINAHWRSITRMKSTVENVTEKLKNKTVAAAWFVTHCFAINHRSVYGHGLKESLNKYNLTVDFYGPCGNKNCPRYDPRCGVLLQNDYYFYLAFENSNCEDYVTEKLITALDHYAVPVVLGGANYSRFMPDGMYLNGNILSTEELAAKINEAIQDQNKYYDYFRWHQYYTYHPAEGGDSDPLCTFCAFLNEESNRNGRRVYAHFTKWWNEYRSHNASEDFIVKYEDSGTFIKNVVTYREQKTEVKIISTPSTMEYVHTFFDDLVNYFFGS